VRRKKALIFQCGSFFFARRNIRNHGGRDGHGEWARQRRVAKVGWVATTTGLDGGPSHSRGFGFALKQSRPTQMVVAWVECQGSHRFLSEVVKEERVIVKRSE